MILWTLQSDSFWTTLQRRGRIRGKWRYVSKTWRPAYLWMARQMVKRGVCTRPVAPIWAYHSCGAIGHPPDQETIEGLMPWDGHSGWKLQVHVPEVLVLLSSYSGWCDILFEWDNPDLQERLRAGEPSFARIFHVNVEDRPPWKDESTDDIQASLPYLRLEWVRAVERYRVPHWAEHEARGGSDESQ